MPIGETLPPTPKLLRRLSTHSESKPESLRLILGRRGTKIASIKNLQNDLAMALASPTGTVRIEAPIPGKSLIGVETPNLSPATVNLRSILSSGEVVRSKKQILVALGRNVAGQPVMADIARMPHVLMAGSTGSGKSTLIHAMLASLLFRNSPEELKLILVDTKRV